MNSDPAKQAWQTSSANAGTLPLDDLRKGADKFYRKIRLRNRIEYSGCAIAIAVFGYRFFVGPTIIHQIGWALLVAALVYMAWQLHRRTAPVSPDMAGTMPIYVFHRAQLVRQRDALKNIIVWYVLPLLPGMAFVFAGNGLDSEIEAAGPPVWQRWLALAGIASFFGFIWWLNQLAARRLQKQIDEIDALLGGNE